MGYIMSTAYIVSNNKLIAAVDTDLKNGAVVLYAYQSVEERLNAKREINLVNASEAKISRAAKWAKAYKFSELATATEINWPGTDEYGSEFLVK
ncbi:hypothetical protein UFOVP244_124 [uncultured Caudovirales phage]|uniref:Uncharacterized protein n=1 Tax=uncultured Caudovirales phage TaxID=2100421 RepID=A0A6J7WU64_9CAUD|nr:hypothetical protein UFOVP244_124 [uncultured Caudovirales phage]